MRWFDVMMRRISTSTKPTEREEARSCFTLYLYIYVRRLTLVFISGYLVNTPLAYLAAQPGAAMGYLEVWPFPALHRHAFPPSLVGAGVELVGVSVQRAVGVLLEVLLLVLDGVRRDSARRPRPGDPSSRRGHPSDVRVGAAGAGRPLRTGPWSLIVLPALELGRVRREIEGLGPITILLLRHRDLVAAGHRLRSRGRKGVFVLLLRPGGLGAKF